MERRYEVEIKALSTGRVVNVVDILAHSKKQAREFARIIYKIDRYSNRAIGKATEYIYQ